MKIRLYHPEPLTAEEREVSQEASHYLCRVLRLKAGNELFLFNANDGEWRTSVLVAHPKKCRIRVESRDKSPRKTPELHLCFAPIKKSRMATIFAMATELGVTHLHPVLTRFTHARLENPERIRRQLIEASEQCERLDVPSLLPAVKWVEWLREQHTPLLACVERGNARPMLHIFADTVPTPRALLIGPEGGFSDQELADLSALPDCYPVHLGERILRSETAVAAALAQYHAMIMP